MRPPRSPRICSYQHCAWKLMDLSSINHWFIRDSLIPILPFWVIGYWGSQGGRAIIVISFVPYSESTKLQWILPKQGQSDAHGYIQCVTKWNKKIWIWEKRGLTGQKGDRKVVGDRDQNALHSYMKATKSKFKECYFKIVREMGKRRRWIWRHNYAQPSIVCF